MSSFNLNNLLYGPCLRTQSHWGWGHPYMNGSRGTIQSIQARNVLPEPKEEKTRLTCTHPKTTQRHKHNSLTLLRHLCHCRMDLTRPICVCTAFINSTPASQSNSNSEKEVNHILNKWNCNTILNIGQLYTHILILEKVQLIAEKKQRSWHQTWPNCWLHHFSMTNDWLL